MSRGVGIAIGGIVSVRVLSWVFDDAPLHLTAAEMLVALALADYASDEGGLAYPSQPKLVTKTRLTRRTVQTALDSLVVKGVITVHLEPQGRRPTVYCFPHFRGEKSAPHDGRPRGEKSAPQNDTRRGAIYDSVEAQFTTKIEATPLKELSIEPSCITPSESVRHARARTRGTYTEEFDTFWQRYGPTNESKKEAFTAWSRLSKKDQTLALNALPRWLSCDQWQRDGGRYKPYPRRYLNQRMWEGEPLVMAPKDSEKGRRRNTAEDYLAFVAEDGTS